MTKGQEAWVAAMPALFVVLWSTGFLGAKFGLPYAEPFTFLSIRFVLVILLLTAVAGLMRARWPGMRLAGHLAVTGILVHGIYLGGVFAAIDHGLPSGLTALVVGLQPVLTALVAGRWLGERVTGRQWLGLVLGLAGITMVVSAKMTGAGPAGFGWPALAFAVGALVGITIGTLYQKRFCTGMDLRSGAAVQYAGATLVMIPAALLIETNQVAWTGEFLFALAWLVLVLSVGAISLLMSLIRRGEAARVASLFYLTPPVTALMAWALFGETLTMVALAGMGVAAMGVALVVRPSN